jgi:hypothetical protein
MCINTDHVVLTVFLIREIQPTALKPYMFVSDPATGTDLSTVEVMSPRLGFKFRTYREMGSVWVKMKNGTIFGMVFSVSNHTIFFS